MKKQQWFAGRKTEGRGAGITRDTWLQAESMITEVAVQVGALINGVCRDSRRTSIGPDWDRTAVTIRFAWADCPQAMGCRGVMRIALSDDGMVTVNSSITGTTGGHKKVSESLMSLRELSREKLGQVLMDNHARVTRYLLVGVSEVPAETSACERDESLWARMKSLALVDTDQQLVVRGI